MMKALTLTEMMHRAIAVARQTGDLQLQHWRKGDYGVEEKGRAADIVTQVDRACEALITDVVNCLGDEVGLLGEENGHLRSDAPWQWVVDPLDGTTNYNAGLPLFGVSIAIRHHDVTMGAVVFAPALNELYTATRGGGAWMNEATPIKPSTVSDLKHAVVSTGFPVDKDVNPDNNLTELSRVLPHVRGMRRLGSAAIDICYVAAGFLDAYWELNLHEWDVAAAELIAAEAGAVTSRYRAGRAISLMAANPVLAPKLLDLLT